MYFTSLRYVSNPTTYDWKVIISFFFIRVKNKLYWKMGDCKKIPSSLETCRNSSGGKTRRKPFRIFFNLPLFQLPPKTQTHKKFAQNFPLKYQKQGWIIWSIFILYDTYLGWCLNPIFYFSLLLYKCWNYSNLMVIWLKCYCQYV